MKWWKDVIESTASIKIPDCESLVLSAFYRRNITIVIISCKSPVVHGDGLGVPCNGLFQLNVYSTIG